MKLAEFCVTNEVLLRDELIFVPLPAVLCVGHLMYNSIRCVCVCLNLYKDGQGKILIISSIR
jgi:hypothetical protein